MVYSFTSEDFRQAFGFAVEYFLDPKKGLTGRTNAQPLGFGAILDQFTRGKLVEIGAKRMIEILDSSKKCQLDFDMKSPNEVREEPDIISIEKNNLNRKPNVFAEIKNTSLSDRWIGITDEQLKSMKAGSNGRTIFIIYLSITGLETNDNPKTSDFVGMYLKNISDLEIFDRFSPLEANAKLEFILSKDKLEQFGTNFPAGDMTYETNLFSPKKLRKKDGTLLSKIVLYKKYRSFNQNIYVKRKDDTIDEKHGLFHIQGDFDLYKKENPKSTGWLINCLTKVQLNSNVFGDYTLEAGKTYDFVLHTLGRDPILKRNNLFIAKRRVFQLIDQGLISNPSESLERIANGI